MERQEQVWITTCHHCGQQLPPGRREPMPPEVRLRWGEYGEVEVTIVGTDGTLGLRGSVEGPTMHIDKKLNPQLKTEACWSMAGNGQIRGWLAREEGDKHAFVYFPVIKRKTKTRTPKKVR